MRINATEHSPSEREIQQQPTKKGAWNKELGCQPVKHYASPFYNANTFIVHIHPLQTNQLLKYNNPFLHSKKPATTKTTKEPSPTQKVVEIGRMTCGGNTEDANMKYTNHLTQQSTKWRTVTDVEQVKRSTSRLKPSTPGKPGWGHFPHQHRPQVCLRPEVLKSHFTALTLVPGAHYKLLLEHRKSL